MYVIYVYVCVCVCVQRTTFRIWVSLSTVCFLNVSHVISFAQHFNMSMAINVLSLFLSERDHFTFNFYE